ncbi:hypothetical protein M441DRAFT_60336 [Trichoderma asperellum CBS 433.97]|uniref:Uncharacterized protein n=1 Tax=Trichoderma asperellum (strain ATCC 204424 / CBS 433.97 / NBRC 101777) TaxID=1042311 RepID=A0A2T3YZR0_TRIA4|nr:hypothetical protein M441DRAFT_60336 [Trichoderma asperellum CBS 433.97]PTB38035.1 hypothetical protein M441DRAFT_60336 [Trichoderma asperellum CBS 433.97]
MAAAPLVPLVPPLAKRASSAEPGQNPAVQLKSTRAHGRHEPDAKMRRGGSLSDRLWVPGEVHKKKREKGTPQTQKKGR